MSLKTIIVQWTGPFTLEEVCESEGGNGIYLLTGKRKYERSEQIQYCGITEGEFCYRINKAQHHKLNEIREETLSIWLGEVVYPKKFKRSHLELAEHCFVYWWQPNLNESKTAYCPNNPVCFISQWFTKDGEARLNCPPIVKDLPDVLWWDEEQWRSGRLKVWPKGE